MADEYLTCPLCGFAFEPQDTLCAHGCPLHSVCGLVRCPSCEYEFPMRRWPRGWLERLVGAARPELTGRAADLRPASALPRGAEAVVRCIGGGRPGRQHRLAVFGLVPGATVVVLQQRPSCVLRIGETELALDPEIAQEILVDLAPRRDAAQPAS